MISYWCRPKCIVQYFHIQISRKIQLHEVSNLATGQRIEHLIGLLQIWIQFFTKNVLLYWKQGCPDIYIQTYDKKLLQNMLINIKSLDNQLHLPAQTNTIRMNMLPYMWTRLVHSPYAWKKMVDVHFTRISFDTRLQTALYCRGKR